VAEIHHPDCAGRSTVAHASAIIVPDEETLAALRAAGYCLVRLDLVSSTLRTAAHAEALVQRISRSGSGVKVWLGEDVSITGLVELLRAVEAAEGRCRALSEIN
jgi:hypothetical protein